MVIEYLLIAAVIIPIVCTVILYRRVTTLSQSLAGYLYEQHKTETGVGHVPPPVLNKKPKRRGSVWNPFKDMDHEMSGKRIDMFD